MRKLYYSISETSIILDEEQHILRYWEKEFEQLKPKKNRGGNRIYSERDLNVLKLIKKFLRVEKLSLQGAKERLDASINDSIIEVRHNSLQPLVSQSDSESYGLLKSNFNENIKTEILKVLNNLYELRQLLINSE